MSQKVTMPMREIVENNILIDTIIGDQGGTTAVEGPIEDSFAIPGTALIPTEHGTLYIDLDFDVTVELA